MSESVLGLNFLIGIPVTFTGPLMQWGVRLPSGEVHAFSSERVARDVQRNHITRSEVVCRTVIIGDWTT